MLNYYTVKCADKIDDTLYMRLMLEPSYGPRNWVVIVMQGTPDMAPIGSRLEMKARIVEK